MRQRGEGEGGEGEREGERAGTQGQRLSRDGGREEGKGGRGKEIRDALHRPREHAARRTAMRKGEREERRSTVPV